MIEPPRGQGGGMEQNARASVVEQRVTHDEVGTQWREGPAPRAKQPPPRIQIERTEPGIGCARYPAKRTVGEAVTVAADGFRDGHEGLRGPGRFRPPGAKGWSTPPVAPL